MPAGTLKVNGLEVTWVQPLDFLLGRYLGVTGFGFTANLTIIDQTGRVRARRCDRALRR